MNMLSKIWYRILSTPTFPPLHPPVLLDSYDASSTFKMNLSTQMGDADGKLFNRVGGDPNSIQYLLAL